MSKRVEDISSESEGSDVSDGSEGWNDVDEGSDNEEQTMEIVSLFDDKVFPGPVPMLEYCKDKFSFDFVATRDRLGLDFFGGIKLVNFIRSTVKEGEKLPEQISEADIQDDEKWMIPVLQDDAFIMCLDDLPTSSGAQDETPAELDSNTAALQAKIDELTKQFANYRFAVEQTLDKRWHADDEPSQPSAVSQKEKKDESQYYWESYASHDIHETMLKDTIRTDAYRDFIYNNKHIFKGKTVLDIGCGTGILSMFCAKAGAEHVYAIDKSAILDKARENVFHNGLDKQITCLRGRVEDIILPVDKVDIIVSEWMGYFLLYEAMLPSVLFARDRYLKPDGLLVPSHATIFAAPVSDPEYVTDTITFWRDVYGFDMKPMQEGIYKGARVETLPADVVSGTPSTYALDLYHCTVEDLSFKMDWASKFTKDSDSVDGFIIWFDNYFATTRQQGVELVDTPAKEWEQARADGSIAFTTGPHGKETHWRQGLLLIEDKEGGLTPKSPRKAGDEIKGTLSFSVAEEYARGLSIKVEWDGLPSAEKAQTWTLH
ncbi:Ribosomal protein arginine N-methyltransferase rmt3 [Cytospora mali]|uniref:type I protein arginine methyltransferase n=1 Tax=Cytospora mali TaxID=578113 RepID=A0A194VVF6_CYTMA|nr:Ribosomal protein arginine N-methyltransferase rmt3 [Valsa mali]